ncbi:exodeoxyribonuclease VII small subunit [Terriglobus tenax]|uniref:exodeoxyribonuclease VII small subunit n=1 Tax=Terriglobus tenax TaxID=1111115 RepID=UPI0021E09523|nr:exodeoxyribonuclease VII small subunit [Terriglobus tenax]
MPTFEENLKSLESVVEQLERGDLPLEDSVKLFEQGMSLSAACKQDLEAAEGKLQVLMKQQNGKLEAKDLSLE